MLNTHVSAKDMLRACEDFESSQWQPLEEIYDKQWKKLHSLFLWTDEHIPFYRERYKKVRLKPQDVSSFEEFRSLPTLNRTDLYNAKQNGLKTGEFPCKETYTTGTSGRKLTVWLTPDYNYLVVFPLWRRALKAGGLQPNDRYQRITIMGGDDEYPTLGRPHDITLNDTTSEILLQIKSTKPNAINSDPSMLEYLSLDIIKHGNNPPESLKRIFTFGDNLTHSARRLIKTAFGCDPIDHYAAREFSSGIAWQCEKRQGYHVNSDNLIVEILDAQGEPVPHGEMGHLVITDLSSRPVPIIRYEIGDIASWQQQPCDCGRSLPCLSSIDGRAIERIMLQSGEWLTPHGINSAIYRVPEVLQYQLREQRTGRIVIDVVLDPVVDHMKVLDKFRTELLKTVLSTVDWELNPVKAIEGDLFLKRRLLVPYGMKVKKTVSI